MQKCRERVRVSFTMVRYRLKANSVCGGSAAMAKVEKTNRADNRMQSDFFMTKTPYDFGGFLTENEQPLYCSRTNRENNRRIF